MVTRMENGTVEMGGLDAPPSSDDWGCEPGEAGSECREYMSFYNDTKEFESLIGLIIPCFFAVIVVLGVLGNLLVVIVAFSRQMRNSTNTLIIGLALSDLLFLIICIPVTALDYATNMWIFPVFTCSLINYCQHISAYCSVYTLTLMALDRFLAVCHPVGSISWRTPKNTFFAILILYSTISVSQIPVGLKHGIYEYEFVVENRSACAYVAIATNNATVHEARAYFVTFNFFGYLLPLTITSVLYALMLHRLWQSPRPGSSTVRIPGSQRSKTDAAKNKRRQVTRLVLSVIVIWAVCWLPLNICFFLSGYFYPDNLVSHGGKFAVVAQIASQVLAYCNSCLNPILYALMSENFRKGFYRVLATAANKLTFGFFCPPDGRSLSRMELTQLQNNTTSTQPSVRRGKSWKKSKKMHHAASAPSCTLTQFADRYTQRPLTESTSLLAADHRCYGASEGREEEEETSHASTRSCPRQYLHGDSHPPQVRTGAKHSDRQPDTGNGDRSQVSFCNEVPSE